MTPVPGIRHTLTDVLTIDRDSNGRPSAGDTLTYIATINNTGGSTARNAIFKVTPDSNSTLIVNSVIVDRGVVVSGLQAGDNSVTVVFDTLTVGESATIRYRATIKSSLPPRTMFVSSQAQVTADNMANRISDDPTTLKVDDATNTILTNDAQVQFYSRAELFNDVDRDGVISLGDILRYQIDIDNTSYADMANIMLSNTPSTYTTLNTGSLSTSQGTIITGNTIGDSRIQINLGSIPAQTGSARVIYYVTVTNATSGTPLFIESQPSLTFNAVSRTLTIGTTQTLYADDPSTDTVSDKTTLVIGSHPLITVSKRAFLAIDVNANGKVDTNDVLQYRTVISNRGTAALSSTLLNAIPDSKTTLVIGSVNTSTGSVVSGNTPGNTSVSINTGTINPGDSIVTNYRVRVKSSVTGSIVARATLFSPSSTVISDDPTTATRDATTSTIGSTPTKIELTAFSVIRNGKTHLIRWSTSSEIDTWRFRIYRVNAKGVRTLVPACSNIISKGSATRGANYECTDRITSATTYVLEEVTRTGGSTFYQTKLRTTTRGLPSPLDQSFIVLPPAP
jgi:uncharacterized repeat protein (TIGR01451 family)